MSQDSVVVDSEPGGSSDHVAMASSIDSSVRSGPGPMKVEERLCLDEFVVPRQSIDNTDFMVITYKLTAKSKWLPVSLGLQHLYQLPARNVLMEIVQQIKNSRGKRSRFFSVKVDSAGKPQGDIIDIVVRDFSLCVVNNAKVVLIKLTSENLEWLIAELRKDLDVGDAAPSTTLATASASSMEPAGCPQADGDPDFMHDLAQLTQRDGDRRWLWAPSLNAFVAKPDGKAGKPQYFFVRKARSRGKETYLFEVQLQKQRMTTFLETGSVPELLASDDEGDDTPKPKKKKTKDTED